MAKKNEVDVYRESFEGIRRERIDTMVAFMREKYPDIPESMAYKMPTYRLGGKKYISFAPMKNYFSLYMCETEILQEIKEKIPKANIGVGCARIKYTEPDDVMDILKEACDKLVEFGKK